MLAIYLTRHGQDEDNVAGILNGHRDNPLTQIGIQQAEELSSKIKTAQIYFDIIYTSPLKRTYQTAEIISTSIKGPKPHILKNLIERDFGVMTGKSISSIEELCAPAIIKVGTINYFLNPQNAETFPELLDRANKVLNVIKNKHQDGNILLVTHGDTGKMLYAAYYNLDWREVLKQFHFGNSDLLLLSPDSLPRNSHIFNIKQENL